MCKLGTLCDAAALGNLRFVQDRDGPEIWDLVPTQNGGGVHRQLPVSVPREPVYVVQEGLEPSFTLPVGQRPAADIRRTHAKGPQKTEADFDRTAAREQSVQRV
jgi:hypothetical protein